MPKDWNQHKAEIRTLYITKGKTLSEVRRLLKGRHGFDASTRAYRLKLDEWGLKKNRTSNRHEEAESPFSRVGISSRVIPTVHTSTSNQAPVVIGQFSSVSTSGPSNPFALGVHAQDHGDWSRTGYVFPGDDAHNMSNYDFRTSAGAQTPEISSYGPRHPDTGLLNPTNEEALHAAVLTGTVEDINNLLSAGASVSTRNDLGDQPLHEAVIRGGFPIVELLLRYGSDVNSLNDRGQTPLHLATSSAKIMQLLLKRDAVVTHQDRDGNTALHIILLTEKWLENMPLRSNLKSLVSAGANINIANNTEASPIQLLVTQLTRGSKDYLEVLLDFLKHDPKLDSPMPNGSSLFSAFIEKLGSILQTRYGYSNHNTNVTTLESRCLYQFISLGANPDTIIKDGRPLLHHFLAQGIHGHISNAPVLIRSIAESANVNMVDINGDYPLHCLLNAPRHNWRQYQVPKLEFLNILIRRGADVNQRNANGAWPLELLFNGQRHVDNINCAITLAETGETTLRCTSTGKSIFDLLETSTSIPKSEHARLMKTFLEFDMASRPEILNPTTHPQWAERWRQACKEPSWIVAKDLISLEGVPDGPKSEKFRDGAFIVIAEKFLKTHKAQLKLWQAGRLDKEIAKQHREEYIAILKDCNNMRAEINPSWYKYLLELMDFG